MKKIGRLGISLILTSALSSGVNGAVPYFEDNFDSGQVKSGSSFRWSGSGNVSQEQSVSGQYSLRFRYGPDARGEDSYSEMRYQLAPDASSAPREVWIEYKLRIPLNFVHRSESPSNNKLFAIWAENYSRSGDIQAVVEYERSSTTSSHIRVICMTGGGCLKGNIYAPILDQSMQGRWVRMRYHLRAGQTDGLTEIWRDDQLIYSIRNYQHYISGGNNYWRNGYIMGWSNSGFTEITDFFVDDFKVFVEDPGWDKTANGGVSPPAPPIDFNLQ